jgi:hypothetical protein
MAIHRSRYAECAGETPHGEARILFAVFNHENRN